MRVIMLIASALAYFINGAIQKARFGNAKEMNFETPLTWLVWIDLLRLHRPHLSGFRGHHSRSWR